MKPPRAYARGILHFFVFGEIRRSTLLAYSAEAAASAAKAGRSPSFGPSPEGYGPQGGGSAPAFIHGLSLLRRSSFGYEGRAAVVFCEGG